MLAVGTPPPVFLPARSYKYEYVTSMESLSVPLRGEYPEASGRSGVYDISPQEGVILFGTLMEVIFAHHAYPKMADNQRFTILGLEIEEDGNQISVMGRVLQFSEE